MDFEIRHAEPKDYAPIIAVVDEWWGGRQMADGLPKLFFVHFRETSFVAESQGTIRGFVTGFRSQSYPEQAYIHYVGIDPATRGSGLGRTLYQRFFEAARTLGCSEVQCVTSPANTTSISFHKAMGFECLLGDAEAGGVPYSTDYDGPGGSRVRFRRTL
ncbi:MAG: GNAT family N-acetyltransferase [Thermomicrobiales bacterium]|nr:GNAT family N-acetyltransferase [Thermomicrobiales bacterium]